MRLAKIRVRPSMMAIMIGLEKESWVLARFLVAKVKIPSKGK